MGRTRRHLRPLHAESVEVFPERLDIGLGEIVDADVSLCGFVNDAVVDIRQVEDVGYFETFEFQVAPQNVAEDERAKVSDMRKIPNRRAADIHPDMALFHRVKFLDLSGKRVEKSEHSFRARIRKTS